MDNFDLHSYLRNNPLLKESIEKEEKKKLTKEEFKAMVKEMVLAETGVDEYLGGTMDVSGDYGMDDDSQTEGDFFTISLPNGFPVQYAGSYEEAKAWVEKNDPEGMKDYQIDQVDESLNEMARIATFYVLTDDFEEAIAGMPENKQKSSRYQRVINYLKDKGQGTLKDIADEEFRTSETAAVSPIMADLVSYGVAKKGDLVAPKKEKSVGDGTRGRKMSDVGRVKSAMEKFKAGSSDYTDEERVALKAFIDSIAATLEEGKVNEEEALTPAQKAALTRAKNKKEDEERAVRYKAEREAKQKEEQERRASGKLPLTISKYWYGYKTERYLGDLAQYYREVTPMQGPGGDGTSNLVLKPVFQDQSFDNAQVAWDVYDRKL